MTLPSVATILCKISSIPGMITSDVCAADLDDGIDCGEEDANCDEDDDNGDDDEDEDAHVCVLHCCW